MPTTPTAVSKDAIQACLRACYDCIQIAGQCVHDCTEKGTRADCALACQDCLDVCLACIPMLTRSSENLSAICGACADVCESWDPGCCSRCPALRRWMSSSHVSGSGLGAPAPARRAAP